MLEVSNIVKIYKTGDIEFRALNNISINIEKGEFTAIMGPSGSGKSTFMNLLGCLDTMDQGVYKLNGIDVSSLKGNDLAHVRNKEIGFVFQSFNLIPRITLLDNVELPMLYAGVARKERRKRAIEALVKVGLEDRMYHMPNEISGGQKQRAAIARALVNNPAVIMADEPTGNLDTKSSADIMKFFKELNDEGVTILIVTHENDIAMHANRIIRFSDGEIVSDETVKKQGVI